MNIEERLLFDNYQIGRNLQLVTVRVPVGDKGAERNEFILWPSMIATWPQTGRLGLNGMDHFVVHLFHVALEAERQGVFERIRAAHKGSGSGSGETLMFLDPIEHAEMFAQQEEEALEREFQERELRSQEILAAEEAAN